MMPNRLNKGIEFLLAKKDQINPEITRKVKLVKKPKFYNLE